MSTTSRTRANPLALAVLVCLGERSMHPYEIATTLRLRHKQDSVRLNYGSLYAVVPSLERRGLIRAQDTGRDGRRPVRTTYELTDAGRDEALGWLTELISTPVKDFTSFEAALSFLPALPPFDVADLLRERAATLELELARTGASQEHYTSHRVPRLHWIEEEYRSVLRSAELTYVRSLLGAIVDGSLEGVDWWHAIHDEAPALSLDPAAAATDR
jgi:DNA-binding PadR family transcriptional regulator